MPKKESCILERQSIFLLTKRLDEHCESEGRIPSLGNSKDKHSRSLDVKCESHTPQGEAAATLQDRDQTPASMRAPAAARGQG